MRFTYTVRVKADAAAGFDDLLDLDDAIEPALPPEYEYDGCQYEEDDELHVYIFADEADGASDLRQAMEGVFGVGSVLEVSNHEQDED